jgi:hypothetical protein
MNPKLKLSKLDCVRRQLEMAIELYFMERDPVSIHTLAGAVYQLLIDINKHRGGKPLLVELESLKGVIVPGREKEVLRLMSEAENFFKHADRDPEGVIDFSPESNESVLWESSMKYGELTGEKTAPMTAMNVWFQLRHPDIFTYEKWKKEKLVEAQLWIKSLSRSQFYKEMLGVALLGGH